MLTDPEMATARQDAIDAGVFPDTGYISRDTNVSTNGITELTVGTVGTAPCRLDPIPMTRAPELYSGEREAAREYFTLSTPYDTDTRDGDHWTINSENYEVLVLFRQHSKRLTIRATVFRVNG